MSQTEGTALCADVSNATSYPVFVYGTLKRGFPNAGQLRTKNMSRGAGVGNQAPTSYLGAATTVDCLPLVVGPFHIPFLLNLPGRSGASRVCGELYAVTPGALDFLDTFEGVSQRFYARVLLRVKRNNLHNKSSSSSTTTTTTTMQASSSQLVHAWAYVRHPGNGGGQRWAREWPVERLAQLRMVAEYTEEHAKGYSRRELAESADGRVSHAAGDSSERG
jgi:gamma-glutamylaminecyclotransferase